MKKKSAIRTQEKVLSLKPRAIFIIYLIAGLVSIGLSILQNARAIINPDGICYLLSAKAIGTDGLQIASNICGQARWPFYSLLIHLFSKFSHLSDLHAAFFLNGIFSLMTVLTFITVIQELGQSQHNQKLLLSLAAFVILVAHTFNSARGLIIRDHGFWAFYLFAFLGLLKFFKKPTWFLGVIVNFNFLIATLFRVEGAIFVLSLPIFSWILLDNRFKNRLQVFIKLNFVLILIILFGALFLFWHAHHSQISFSRLEELIAQVKTGVATIIERYQNLKLAMTQHVLTIPYSSVNVSLVLYLVLFFWYLILIINNISWIYLLILLYACASVKNSITLSGKRLLLIFISINVLITALFFLENLFLSKRYLVALSLILFCYLPFALYQLRTKKQFLIQMTWYFVCIVMIGLNLGLFFNFGTSKTYIYSAGEWLNQTMPKNAILYVNDEQLMYYTHRFERHFFETLTHNQNISQITEQEWKRFNYFAIHIQSQKNNIESTMILKQLANQVKLIKKFNNYHGDVILIYKRESS